MYSAFSECVAVVAFSSNDQPLNKYPSLVIAGAKVTLLAVVFIVLSAIISNSSLLIFLSNSTTYFTLNSPAGATVVQPVVGAFTPSFVIAHFTDAIPLAFASSVIPIVVETVASVSCCAISISPVFGVNVTVGAVLSILK